MSLYPSLRWAQAQLSELELAATEIERRIDAVARKLELATGHQGLILSPNLFRQEIRLEHLNEARSALRRLVRQIEHQERFPSAEHMRRSAALRDVWAGEVTP